MRLKNLFHNAVERLQAAGIPDPETDAAVLLGHHLRMSRTEILLTGDRDISESLVASFADILARRLKREPVAYIHGEREFWSLSFKVNRDVLIPRPETEFLVETVLGVLRGQPKKLMGPVLDLGSGSGVIPIILALELPEAPIFAVDISWPALQVAAENARRHKVDNRICFIASDWCAGLSLQRGFEVIVSNPPYVVRDMLAGISGGQLEALEPEVRLFEPRLALDGGQDGVACIDRIMVELSGMLRPGGWFFMEIGADQGEYVMDCFGATGWFDSLKVYRDYAGLSRVLQARLKK